MSTSDFPITPLFPHYDVVIVGGATSGSSIAWNLSINSDFKRSVLVVERDPSLQYSTTKSSNSCMRQQSATTMNVQIAQYAADFVKSFGAEFPPDECVPDPPIRNFGYLYLSDSSKFTEVLETDQNCRPAAEQVRRCVSLNLVDEGAFNAFRMVQWLRSTAHDNSVEYIGNEVIDVSLDGSKVRSIKLQSGEQITVGTLVNAAGTRAATISRLAGISLAIHWDDIFTDSQLFCLIKLTDKDVELQSKEEENMDGIVQMLAFFRDQGVLPVDGIVERRDHEITCENTYRFKDIFIGLAKDEAERNCIRSSGHIKDFRNNCSNGLTELCEANHSFSSTLGFLI